MSHSTLKSKLFGIIGRVSMIGMLMAGVIALTFTVPAAQPAYADTLTPPSVPAAIQLPVGNKAYFVGHAVGKQNYVCVPSGGAIKFVLLTPVATLFDDNGGQLVTHYFSPNPAEANTDPRVLSDYIVRAAWQDSRDSSLVWGQVKPGNSSTDSAFVEAGAIPWLLVTIVGTQNGPAGGDRLTVTTYIHRVNTHGGAAPSTGCSTTEDLGRTAFVPYTADYYFYKSTGNVK